MEIKLQLFLFIHLIHGRLVVVCKRKKLEVHVSKAKTHIYCIMSKSHRMPPFQSPVLQSIRYWFLLIKNHRKDESISSSFLILITLSAVERQIKVP